MKNRPSIYLVMLLCGALLLGTALGYGLSVTPGQDGDSMGLASGYDNGLTAALSAAESLKLNLNKAAVSAGGANQALILSQAQKDAADAARALEGLPMGAGMQNEMLRYLSQMSEWCEGMSRRILLGESLSTADTDQILQENGTVAAMLLELREARDQIGPMDFETEAMKRREEMLQTSTPLRFADLFGYESELEETNYPQLSYTGLLTEEYLNREARGLSGKTASEDTMLEAARRFMQETLDTNCEVSFMGLSDSAVPVGFIEAVAENGAVWNLTVSQAAGQVLSAYGQAAPGTESNLRIADCEEKALAFVEKAGFGAAKVVSAKAQGNMAVLSLRLWEENGTAAASDTCTVWVDMASGDILAFDAGEYYRNATERSGEAVISADEALAALSERLMPKSAELIWWQLADGTEALCYACEADFAGDRFTVLIDAMTGREVDIRQSMQNDTGYSLQ